MDSPVVVHPIGVSAVGLRNVGRVSAADMLEEVPELLALSRASHQRLRFPLMSQSESYISFSISVFFSRNRLMYTHMVPS